MGGQNVGQAEHAWGRRRVGQDTGGAGHGSGRTRVGQNTAEAGGGHKIRRALCVRTKPVLLQQKKTQGLGFSTRTKGFALFVISFFGMRMYKAAGSGWKKKKANHRKLYLTSQTQQKRNDSDRERINGPYIFHVSISAHKEETDRERFSGRRVSDFTVQAVAL